MSIRSIASVGLLAGATGIASVGYLDADRRLTGWDVGAAIPYHVVHRLSRGTLQREADAAIPASGGNQRLTADLLFPERVKPRLGEKISELAGKKAEEDARAAKRAAEAGDKAREAAESLEAKQRTDLAAMLEDELVLLLLEELLS